MEALERNAVNEREVYEEERPLLCWVLEKIAAILPVSEKSKIAGKGSVRPRAIEA